MKACELARKVRSRSEVRRQEQFAQEARNRRKDPELCNLIKADTDCNYLYKDVTGEDYRSIKNDRPCKDGQIGEESP